MDRPADLVHYKTSGPFQGDTIPKGLLRRHNTRAGVWGEIVVHSGALLYELFEGDEVASQATLRPHSPGWSAPQQWHRVRPLSEETSFSVRFHRAP